MQYIRRMSNREHLKLLDWSSPLAKRRLIHCHVERGAWGQPWGSQPTGYVGPGGHDHSAGWFSPKLCCCCANSQPSSTSSEGLAGGKTSETSFLSLKSDAAVQRAPGKQNWWVRRCHFHAATFLRRTAYSCYGSSLQKRLLRSTQFTDNWSQWKVLLQWELANQTYQKILLKK